MSEYIPKACARCGRVRRALKTAKVCGDCKLVLSKEEWAIWNDLDPEVESDHETEAA